MLLSCAPTQAEEIFAFLRPPSQMQIAPQAASPTSLNPAREDPDENVQLPARLQRQIVSYSSREASGTVIIDTTHTYLFYVIGNGKAVRYGIGVGREGFTWSGVKSIIRKSAWPDWYPPPAMIARQPYLPRMIAGGPGNPLGARAMYIGGTEYRIHGTNDPSSIGKQTLWLKTPQTAVQGTRLLTEKSAHVDDLILQFIDLRLTKQPLAWRERKRPLD